MKVKTKLARLRKKFPHRHATGFLYRDGRALRRKYSVVMVHTILAADDGGFSLHALRMGSGRHGARLSIQQWERALRAKLNTKYEYLIAAIENRTGKAWTVHAILGFSDYALSVSSAAAHAKKRRQT